MVLVKNVGVGVLVYEWFYVFDYYIVLWMFIGIGFGDFVLYVWFDNVDFIDYFLNRWLSNCFFKLFLD